MSDPPKTGLNHGYTLRKTLGQRATGMALLDYLSQSFRHSDEATWRGRIARAEVLVDEARVEPDTPLRQGQVLAWIKPPWREPDAPLHFAVLYEDKHLLAVDKPSGLPTLPGSGFQEHTLLSLVRAHAPGASPMHRLGRGTSGVVLFCKSAEAARGVQAQWRQPGVVAKRYLALVSGHPPQDHFTVDSPIGLVPDTIIDALYCATPDGKPSLSRFTVLARHDTTSLAAVDIETGRPHQIRIHAAAAGYPLLGDPLYGPGGGRTPGSEARPGDLGYRLHAWQLGLEHPLSGERRVFEAAPPEALRPG